MFQKFMLTEKKHISCIKIIDCYFIATTNELFWWQNVLFTIKTNTVCAYLRTLN